MALATESNSQEFQGLFSLYMAIGIAVAAIVLLTIAYALIRYRRRDGVSPSEVKALKPIELVWVVLVAATVAGLLVATFRTEDRVDAVSAHPAQTVRVVAFQWGWRFAYPGTGVAITGNSERPPTLVVPADVTVRFEITSRDVIHSFWIPALRFKRDAFPNRTSEFNLVVDPGVTTTGECAEFCGLGHDRMDFELVSMDARGFEHWLNRREDAGRGSEGAA
jgi:cytochrome c oxidase subunit 2